MEPMISLSKIEYLRLKRRAIAYENLMRRFFETVIKDPVDEVVEDFKRTNLYTKEFLVDLKEGLKKSSYGKL